MAQQLIDGVLFSPVPAHALEPGDLVALTVFQVVFRLTEATPTAHATMRLRAAGQRNPREVPANAPVLRAVGARASRGGAR